MPELPDVEVYIDCLKTRILGEELRAVRLGSPFVLRSVDPTIREAAPRQVVDILRMGKRIVLALEDELFLVLHLMIAGRLRWEKPGCNVPRKVGLVAFDFHPGTLLLCEAGSKKRASLHLVRKERLQDFDRGGLEVLNASSREFEEALTRENHTLKRALTDPTLFSGIGNAYSDEILHHARLSPVKLTSRLEPSEIARLARSTAAVLKQWTERLRAQVGRGFPQKVSAFRQGMAVHGRYRQPCPDCGSPVQRILYAQNECNYCARCQNNGRLLADRSLSRLLKSDWPRSLEELEELRSPRRGGAIETTSS